MADNFGLKLGIDGEREFKKALSEINQTFKVLGSEMKLVSSQFDKNDKSVESLTARNQVLNKEIDAQKEKIETLKSALANAAEFIEIQEQNTENLDRFVSLVRSHIEDDGLNGYNLHELIQGIYIENADVPVDSDGNIEADLDDDEGEIIVITKKPKTSTAKKQRIRKIHIKYDFIGFIPIKSLMQYAEESEKRPNEEISA